INAMDLQAHGLKHGDRIDVESRMATGEHGVTPRSVRGFIAVEYDIPRGSTAMYYPEGNCLVPLDSHDPKSGTPAYKSIPVRIAAARDAAERDG
ncbi:MAG TPA: molybdopterin dinucleotide binding domain-containing protein, partial [Pseudoxanthomonas sp.]|nr:molybdopterin dinucleotide binding domain-containing protein [Pseudoxanthomonas sp.]